MTEKNPDHIKDESGTPASLFQKINLEFQFSIDACASEFNHKLPRYYTKEIDGLKQSYANERVWCNPPYSRGKHLWVEKAYAETRADCILWVLLLPTSTEQSWFQDIANVHAEIRFLRGRQTFDRPKGFEGNWTTGRDSHMLVIFRNPTLLIW